jgi:hypothetical protein
MLVGSAKYYVESDSSEADIRLINTIFKYWILSRQQFCA